MPSILMGVMIGLCLNYRERFQKAAKELKELHEQETWEEYEDFREQYGYSQNTEYIPRRKKRSRTPRKKHRY